MPDNLTFFGWPRQPWLPLGGTVAAAARASFAVFGGTFQPATQSSLKCVHRFDHRRAVSEHGADLLGVHSQPLPLATLPPTATEGPPRIFIPAVAEFDRKIAELTVNRRGVGLGDHRVRHSPQPGYGR